MGKKDNEPICCDDFTDLVTLLGVACTLRAEIEDDMFACFIKLILRDYHSLRMKGKAPLFESELDGEAKDSLKEAVQDFLSSARLRLAEEGCPFKEEKGKLVYDEEAILELAKKRRENE